jgi:aspartate/methionine/tyrosine aminotransferase
MDMMRPDTVIGRGLAERAIMLASVERARAPIAAEQVTLDLTDGTHDVTALHIRDAAKDALDRGETHYTSGPGILKLRSAIAERSTAEGFPASADAIVVTNGGSEAIYIALQSVLRPGDRVLIAGPIAPNVVRMIEFVGAVPVHLTVRASNRFLPEVAQIEASEPAPRALLLGSPSPVTGVALSDDRLRDIIAAADDRGITTILDRSLAWCAYNASDVTFSDPDLAARVLTVGSFSHAYAMSGWRVGYFTAPIQLIDEMRELKLAMSICTSSISQFAALAALEGPEEWLAARRAEFSQRRDLALQLLDNAGIGAFAPDAWPALLLDTRLIHPDDHQAAAMIARDTGVLVEPASRYGPTTTGYTRITLAAGEDALRRGLEQIAAFHNACG